MARRRAVIILDAQTEEARAEVARLEGGLEEAGVAALQSGDAIERSSEQAEAALRQQAAAADRASASTGGMARAAGTANQFATELGQASQDAAFGIQNVANQLPLLQEQFGRLQSQTGGTITALKAVGSSLLGPAGIIAGVSLLLTFKEEIIAFFQDSAGAAEDFKEATEEATEAITEFEGFKVAGLRIGPQDVEPAIRALRGEITAIETQRRILRERIRENFDLQAEAEGVLADEQQRRLDALRDEVQALDERETQFETFIEQLEEQRETMQRQQDLREVIRGETDLQLETTEDLTEETGRAADEAERYVSALSGPDIFQVSKNLEQVRQFMARQRRGTPARQDLGPRFGLPSQRQLQQQMFTGQMVGGGIGQARAGGQAIRGALEAAQDLDLIFDPFEEGQEIAEEFGETTEQQIGRIISASAQMGQALAQAFGEGEVSAQRMISSVLSGIGSILAATGNPIAGGALSGVGGIISGLQHGGTVRTPLQIVGERGPEVVALPRGSRVHSNRESRRMMDQSQVVEEIRSLRGAIRNMRVRVDAFRAKGELGRAQSESERAGNAIYPNRG